MTAPPRTGSKFKARTRALNSTIPDDLPTQLMRVAARLDAALITPAPQARAGRLRDVLDDLDAFQGYVRAAARKAAAEAAVTS